MYSKVTHIGYTHILLCCCVLSEYRLQYPTLCPFSFVSLWSKLQSSLLPLSLLLYKQVLLRKRAQYEAKARGAKNKHTIVTLYKAIIEPRCDVETKQIVEHARLLMNVHIASGSSIKFEGLINIRANNFISLQVWNSIPQANMVVSNARIRAIKVKSWNHWDMWT